MGNQAHFPFWWVTDSLLVCLLKELFGQLLMHEHDSEWWSLGSRTGVHTASPLNWWIIRLPSLLSVKSCTWLCFLPALILPHQDSWGADGQEGYHATGKKKKIDQVLSVVLKARTGNQSIWCLLFLDFLVTVLQLKVLSLSWSMVCPRTQELFILTPVPFAWAEPLSAVL